ncbi:hypothetical protein HYFRA_00005725 [Hymenoscyphus fraxineus]|uniref:Cation efflux protein transmembrane domain-containing protein n=1 Tax=Hymenoscyphus fraxineus TaxID=746836 RepID=A0A9N9PQC2_9HELO|nr:hypothetical protein HYFRA_00005725 [Hymenoscyphus fraxineus]
MFSHFSRKDKLYAAIIISAFIFSMETIVGFHTHSLVLLADAIHALNNILTFSIILSAEKLLEAPPKLQNPSPNPSPPPSSPPSSEESYS